MLLAVEEDHRTPVPVLVLQLRVGIHVHLTPRLAGDLANPGDRLLGDITQMTLLSCDQRQPYRHDASLSFALRTLPVMECGNSVTKSIVVGSLNRARLRAQCAIRSSRVTGSATTTYALTHWPLRGPGPPTTPAAT